MNKLVFLEPTMKATDEQIERVRELSKYSHGLHAEEALAAVLAELTALRKLAEAVEAERATCAKWRTILASSHRPDFIQAAAEIGEAEEVVDAAMAEARK